MDRLERYKIMIVDDEAEVREGIVEKLDWESLGYCVAAEAENGQDALEKADWIDLDLVLTDIKMPFMDGLELGAALRRSHPAVKLVILSGFDEFEFAKQAIKLDVVEYVLKPVNVEELSEALQRVKRLLDSETQNKRNVEVLREAYRKSRPLFRESFLSDLIRGSLSAREIERGLTDYEIELDSAGPWVVAVFDIDAKDGKTAIEARELIPVSVKQTIDDALRGRCRAVTFMSASTVVAIISSWGSENPAAALMEVANGICAECRRVFGISVTAGIGRGCDALPDIARSFAEAKAAGEYKMLLGPERAIYIDDMEERHPGVEPIDSDIEQRLFYALKFGSREAVEALVGEIVDLREQFGGQLERETYLLSVVHAIAKAARQYQIDGADFFSDGNWLRIFGGQEDRQRVREALCNICLQISDGIRNKRISATQNLIKTAKNFIAEHYSESALSVEMLCEHLHISPSYFSTIFKQETGQSYVQYLTGVRMKRAVEMLETTDEKTYAIAAAVGYDEQNYFSYVFKKQFGVSPSKYRR